MDLARLIGAFWVVTVHVAWVPQHHRSDIPLSWWWWANVYDSASQAAVPLFLMLSGALLLTQDPWDASYFFKHRASKLLLPLIGWTLIYEAWGYWLGRQIGGPREILRSLLDGLNAPSHVHLWFLWVIARVIC
jgi:surface polysaccharide O-acyltransferase-like enzyme